MNSNPLVSVIIATYNRDYCIDRAIKSVIDQTYQNWELLIIDNNSQDNTDKVVASFDDPRISMHKILNGGIVAKSRNLGIQLSSGKFIAILDSDDSWTEKKLEKSILILINGADFVYHDLYLKGLSFISSFSKRRLKARSLASPVFDDLWFNGNAINNSSVVLSKELLIKAGSFSEDPDVLTAEDYFCWLELSKLTEKFIKINVVMGFYWIGDNMTSSDKTLESNNYLINVFGNKDYPNEMPGWMHYKNSRALLETERFQSSADQALRAMRAQIPIKLKIKALITWFHSKLLFKFH